MAASEEAKAKIKFEVDYEGIKKFEKGLKARIETLRKESESELKKLEKAAEDTKKAMHGKLTDGAKSVASAFVGALKGATIAGVAGAIAMARSNNQAAQSFRHVAFAMKMGSGAATDWSALQKKAFEIGKQFGTSQEDVAAGMNAVFGKTGDKDFTVKSMESLSAASLASGQSMETLGTIAGELHSKFGVTSDQIDDAMAKVLEFGNKGGMSVEDIAGAFGAMGKTAAKAGVQGIDGFSKLIALSAKMGGQVGGETVALQQLGKVLVKLGPSADAKTKSLLKQMGVKGGTSMEVLGSLMEKSGGNEAKLSQILGPEAASFLATGLGKNGFDEAMTDAGKGTAKGSDVRDEANKIAAEDPEVQFKKAMSQIAQRFAAPDAMAAMDRLTKALPQLADAAVAAVNIISDHPKLAMAGAAVGLGGGQAASMVSSVVGIVSSMRAASTAAAALKAAQAGTTAATTAQTSATAAATVATQGFAASALLAVGALAALAGASYIVYKELEPELRDGTDPVKSNELEGKRIDAGRRLEAVKSGDSETLQRMKDAAILKAGATGSGDKSLWGKAINAQMDAEYDTDIESAKSMKGINAYREETGTKNWAAIAGATATGGAIVGATQGPAAQQRTALDRSAESLQSLPSRLAAQELRVRVTNPNDIKPAKGEGIFDG